MTEGAVCKSSSLQTVPSSSLRSLSGTFASGPTSGPAILSRIAFDCCRSAQAAPNFPSRSLRPLPQSYSARPCLSTMRWTPIHSSLLGLPASSLLRPIVATALGAHSRNMSCARLQRAVIPPFISSRPALRISFHISAGVLSSKRGTKAPMSSSCRTPNSPNQTMKPTQNFVVSFRFMRTSTLKVLDGLSLSR